MPPGVSSPLDGEEPVGRPRGTPRTRWRDYISLLAWERLGIPQEELESVAGRRKPGGPCFAGCHRDPAPDKRTREWMDGWN